MSLSWGHQSSPALGCRLRRTYTIGSPGSPACQQQILGFSAFHNCTGQFLVSVCVCVCVCVCERERERGRENIFYCRFYANTVFLKVFRHFKNENDMDAHCPSHSRGHYFSLDPRVQISSLLGGGSAQALESEHPCGESSRWSPLVLPWPVSPSRVLAVPSLALNFLPSVCDPGKNSGRWWKARSPLPFLQTNAG